jgi:elongation factor G
MMADKAASGPRCAALVGPYLSGKTTLLESVLFVTGKIHRKGSVKDGNTVGDRSAEARARQMSTEVSVADTEFLGDKWTFIDCPGSIEFLQETLNALMVADVAVVVCEPEPEKALMLSPLLRHLDRHDIPHMLFVNKMDHASCRVRDLMAALQQVSERPLVLRQIPIRNGDSVTGYVDVVSERAYHYKPAEPSDLVGLPGELEDRKQEVRQELLESLADFDDTLLEQLLEDVVPPKEEVYRHLTENLRRDRVVPVLLGSADRDGGVRRLMKALRHEAPPAAMTAERLGVEAGDDLLIQVFKTYHQPHTGKLSLGRVWRGTVGDGMTLGGERVSGLYTLLGHDQQKVASAGPGEVVALGRVDGVKTGDAVTAAGPSEGVAAAWPEPLPPVYGMAISAENRQDEVKLSGALQKLLEEDSSLAVEHNPDTHEMVLNGRGEIHLQVAVERLKSKYNLEVVGKRPQVPYKETIRKAVDQHARFKRQTGGHGQFADVKVKIRPLPRGEGFVFQNQIVGGAIPRNFIPSVENGIKDYLTSGPLGFPVVDFEVTLYDGQTHSVDSSDQAFRTAGTMAVREGLPKCEPVLLEPIVQVTISVPSEHTSKLQRVVSGRRGQILGYDAKPGWEGWDELQALMPEAELHDLIVELRSLTLGVGSYTWTFDHLQELTGRLADQVIEQRAAEAAQ